MARSIGILILIALGSAVAGVLFAFLLYSIFQRSQKRRQAPFHKNVNLIMTGVTKQLPTIVKVGISKPNGYKADTFEILFNKNNNTVIVENYQKSPKLNVPEEPEIIKQHNITIKDAPKESLILNTLQGQTIADRKNIPTSESQIESHQTAVLDGTEITNQQKTTTIGKPRKSSKPITMKGRYTPKQKDTLTIEVPMQSPVLDAPREQEIISPQMASINERRNEYLQSDIIKELKNNLAIATKPWADELLSFQTICWDSTHAENEPLLTSRIQDLIQLYIDVGLANNIVWMAKEFGHRSKELDEGYIRLCTNIAERIKKIMLKKMGSYK